MRLSRTCWARRPPLSSRRSAPSSACRGALGGRGRNCAAADGAGADRRGHSCSPRARREACVRKPGARLAQHVEQPGHQRGQQQRGRKRKTVLASLAYEVDITGQAPEAQLAQQWIDPADECERERENDEPPEQGCSLLVFILLEA